MYILDEPPPGRQLSPPQARSDRSITPLILLADGDADVADFTCSVLRRQGFDVVVVHDGMQAMHRWAAEQPDLVLLEVNLEGRDGFGVCKEIRRQSRTPVIMLTTRRDEQDVLRGFEAGADDYIVKPFSPLQLLARIAVALRRRT